MRTGHLIGALLVASVVTGSSRGGSHESGGTSSGSGLGPGGGFATASVPAAVSGGYRWYGPPYYVTIGPNGMPIVFGPPMLLPPPMLFPTTVFDRGPLGGPMPVPLPREFARPAPQPRPIIRAKRGDSTKSDRLVTIGDRLFRAGNLKRAEERYEQARRADPGSAVPHLRLEQVALVRGQYAEAANRLREAIAAEPGWLAKVPNIQAIYGEPAEFNRPINKLESHLLAEPTDRDAWLVLGAQLYLSGRTRRAADVFLRLTDRKPDATLTAFLEASDAQPPDAR